jgi:hypothetical protein
MTNKERIFAGFGLRHSDIMPYIEVSRLTRLRTAGMFGNRMKQIMIQEQSRYFFLQVPRSMGQAGSSRRALARG